MISLRLPDELANKLNQVSKTEKITKSEVIKRALKIYFEKYRNDHSSYDLGKDLFGEYGSGDGNLSVNYKIILKDKLREKHSR